MESKIDYQDPEEVLRKQSEHGAMQSMGTPLRGSVFQSEAEIQSDDESRGRRTTKKKDEEGTRTRLNSSSNKEGVES